MACFDREPRRNHTQADEPCDAEDMTDESLDESSSEPIYLDDEPMLSLEYLASLRHRRRYSSVRRQFPRRVDQVWIDVGGKVFGRLEI
jgi:hypothetical protein